MTERIDAAGGVGRDDADAEADGSVADDAGRERMRDVSHTPPGGEGTNDVWSRGGNASPVREPSDE